MNYSIKIGVLIISLCSLIHGLNAQNKVYRKAEWPVGSSKESGTTVERTEGENAAGFITNIGYQSQQQLIDQLKADKKAGVIGGDKYKSRLTEIETHCKGGMVYFFVQRKEEAAANNQNFEILIKGANDEIFYQKKMREKSAKATKSGDGYKNDGNVFVKSEVVYPITIEVVEGEKVYKFKVAE